MDEFSILVVNEYGLLKRMRVPIAAKAIFDFQNFQKNQPVKVTRIRATDDGKLLYEIDGLLFPYTFFTIGSL